MTRSSVAAVALLAAVALPSAARASHYFIVDLPDVIPAAHHKALLAAGIQTTGDLYDRAAATRARHDLAARTGIPEGDLATWARFVDLLQLSGVGPKMVRLLNASEIGTLRDLQAAEASALQVKMRAANRGNKYSELVPSADVVKGWIEQARKVTPRLE